ncbi:MAG TPA: HEAT repeat domain-containing protein [Gemmatimonadaceae bacterium]|nr:HEAT repeat domain-containing protein [Gemmatimonadaceae bacterium]
MDYAVLFARHFSRLVWLLLHERENVDEQKAALRALVTVAKDGPVHLVAKDWRLQVNGQPLPEVLTGVQDLTAQLIGHAVAELKVDQGALPGDLLGFARLVSMEPIPGVGGAAIEYRLHELEVRTLHVVPAAGAAPAVAPAPRAAPPDRPAELPPEPKPKKSATSPIGSEESSGTYLAFAAVQQPKTSATDLLAQVDAAKSVNVMTRVLDELVALADVASRDGRTDVVVDAMHGVVAREAAAQAADVKRAFQMAARRLNKPVPLRMIAGLLPRRRERAEDLLLVLGRFGEDGADALIEQLTAAQSLSDRRIYFDALVKLKAGVPALTHMLGDARWYVARNAADLLGEMQAKEAEVPLAELLKHDDERVRRAATTALAKLGTGRAQLALRQALKDPSAQVRLQAAAGLSARKESKSAHTLAQALDEEQDAEVQLHLIAALGRLATPDAVQKLIKLAEPGGAIFGKKSAETRVAAVQALGEAHTSSAMRALEALRDDKDKEVREAVFRAALQAASAVGAQRATGSTRAVKKSNG